MFTRIYMKAYKTIRTILVSFYDLVNEGICVDPLNGSDVYYYGDIFINFNCTSGNVIDGVKTIQCVKGVNNDDMIWDTNFSECTGE